MRDEKWEMRNEKELWINKKKDFFIDLSNQYIKMNYHWFNKQEILQKSKRKLF